MLYFCRILLFSLFAVPRFQLRCWCVLLECWRNVPRFSESTRRVTSHQVAGWLRGDSVWREQQFEHSQIEVGISCIFHDILLLIFPISLTVLFSVVVISCSGFRNDSLHSVSHRPSLLQEGLQASWIGCYSVVVAMSRCEPGRVLGTGRTNDFL